MYKLLLIFKYLGRKLAPLFAAMAVTLCTAMVIIVISVMGGFLDLMRNSAKKLTGEVTVYADLSGFPHYEQLLTQLRELPEVEAATAITRSFGLINLYNRVITAEVVGIDGPRLDAVTGYRDTLYWTTQHLIDELAHSMPPADQITPQQRSFYEDRKQQLEKHTLRDLAMNFTPTLPGNNPSPIAEGIVPGIEMNPYNHRGLDGQYPLHTSTLGTELTLTVLPLTQRGTVMEPSVRRLVVVNEFKSGLYDVDANRVYVPFDVLQKMMRMNATEQADPETGMPTGEMEPAPRHGDHAAGQARRGTNRSQSSGVCDRFTIRKKPPGRRTAVGSDVATTSRNAPGRGRKRKAATDVSVRDYQRGGGGDDRRDFLHDRFGKDPPTSVCCGPSARHDTA